MKRVVRLSLRTSAHDAVDGSRTRHSDDCFWLEAAVRLVGDLRLLFGAESRRKRRRLFTAALTLG
jgi:hypothetical protein